MYNCRRKLEEAQRKKRVQKIRKWLKSLTWEQATQWLLHFAAMGLVLSIIVLILSFIHGELPLYIHGVAALEAGVFATISTLIRQGKIFKKRKSEGKLD